MRLLRRLTPHPPRVFLSYRRKDSKDATGRLYRALSETFGDEAVFMDTVDDRPAEDFAQLIRKEIPKSDWMVVMIGRHWAVDADGTKRMSDGDYVRMEVALAIREKVPLVPVLIDGADMPGNLPADIAPVAALGALEAHHTHFDDDAARIAKFVDRRIVTTQGLGSVAIALILAFLTFQRGFDLGEWARTEDLTMSVGDLLSKTICSVSTKLCPLPPPPNIVVVGIENQKANEDLELPKSLRPDFARLVDMLSKAHARTIAFDLAFDRPSTLAEIREFDRPLIKAMLRARNAHTRVVVGGGRFGRKPTLVERAAGVRGLACIGKRYGYATVTPVAALRTIPGQPRRPLLLSLPLLAAYPLDEDWWATFWDARPQILLGDTAGDDLFAGSFVEEVGDDPRDCPEFEKGDTVVTLMRRPSPPDTWEPASRRVSFEKLLATPSIPTDQFKGAVVLVGLMNGRDHLTTTFAFGSGERPGVLLHADTLSNLMQRRAVQPLSDRATAVLTLCAGLLGWILRRSGGATASVIVPVVAGIAVFLVPVIVYMRTPLLVSIPYALIALILVYLRAGRPVPRVRGS